MNEREERINQMENEIDFLIQFFDEGDDREIREKMEFSSYSWGFWKR
jgi:hypothetical protein